MATTTVQPIKVRESVRKYEALVAPALEPREEEDEVSIETNARFPVRDLRLIFERAEGPLGIRDSPSAIVDSECAMCEPLGFVVYGPTASAVASATTTSSAADATTMSAAAPAATTSAATTTATTTATITITAQPSTAIRTSAVVKTPTPPPPKAPRAPHPLACVFHGSPAAAAAAPTTRQPVQAGATSTVSTAYAAYVKQLVAAKKTDVSVAAARVGLRVEQVEKAAASVDDSSLASALRGLVLDASFLGHTAYHHVLLFSKELERASKWVRDADVRVAAMTSQLAARERKVAMLHQALAVAQQENVAKKDKEKDAASASATASVMASAPTTPEANDQEKHTSKTVMATATTTVALQDPITGAEASTSVTLKDIDVENKINNENENDGERDDVDSSDVIEYTRRWAKLHDVQRKQRVALETILAKSRAMTESVEFVESVDTDYGLSPKGDYDGETVTMENPEAIDKSSYEDFSAFQRDANEETATTMMAVPAIAPAVRVPSEAPKPTRHIVQPKIHGTCRRAGASMVEPINATHCTPSRSTSAA